MKSVCYNCPDRAVVGNRSCHSTCEKYLNAKAEHDRERVEKLDAYLKEKDIKEMKGYYLDAVNDDVIRGPLSRFTHWMSLPEPPEEGGRGK